jgi:hypothetical protein
MEPRREGGTGATRSIASFRSRLSFFFVPARSALRFQHAAANVPASNGSRVSRAVRIRGR